MHRTLSVRRRRKAALMITKVGIMNVGNSMIPLNSHHLLEEVVHACAAHAEAAALLVADLDALVPVATSGRVHTVHVERLASAVLKRTAFLVEEFERLVA